MSADSCIGCPKCEKELHEEGEEGSLYEYYEQGIYENEYFVDYHSKCENCGFEFSFNHKVAI